MLTNAGLALGGRQTEIAEQQDSGSVGVGERGEREHGSCVGERRWAAAWRCAQWALSGACWTRAERLSVG